MSKEKQIEEVAVIIEQANKDAIKNLGQLKILVQNWFGQWYASAFYEAGCRMQSEGEIDMSNTGLAIMRNPCIRCENKDLCDMCELAILRRRIADDLQKAATEWISVEERFPEQYGLFLIADDKGNMEAATWTKQFGWFSGSNRVKRVTHWMPLPDPPTKKGE